MHSKVALLHIFAVQSTIIWRIESKGREESTAHEKIILCVVPHDLFCPLTILWRLTASFATLILFTYRQHQIKGFSIFQIQR